MAIRKRRGGSSASSPSRIPRGMTRGCGWPGSHAMPMRPRDVWWKLGGAIPIILEPAKSSADWATMCGGLSPLAIAHPRNLPPAGERSLPRRRTSCPPKANSWDSSASWPFRYSPLLSWAGSCFKPTARATIRETFPSWRSQHPGSPPRRPLPPPPRRRPPRNVSIPSWSR